MRKQYRLISMALWLLAVGLCDSPIAGEENPAAVTTADPQIPVEELELILKAYTKDELMVEADGWQRPLRTKLAEIGTAEIAVKRQNRGIEKAKEIQAQAQEAQAQLETL